MQQVEERVRRELHAQRRQVRAGERALERRGAQLRVAQALIEGEAHDQRQTEAVGDQEARDARDPDRDFVGGKTLPAAPGLDEVAVRSEEHTSELQSLAYLVCRLLLEKKK